jgi:hypothetical protein
MRRILLALTVSIAVHLLVVALAVAFGLWQVARLVPAVKVQPITVDVKDLPLGAPPPKETTSDEEPVPRARRAPRRQVATASDGVTVPVAGEARTTVARAWTAAGGAPGTCGKTGRRARG